jgi:uncharacterized protein YidB (DUF937 family)
MSLLDLAGQLLGGQAGGANQNPLGAVMAMVNNHPGGLPGLISSFEQGGLGGAVSSWVSPGTPNQPVSGPQVQNALGSAQIEEVATKLGLPPEAASAVIAQMLPAIVDHLTPNGQVPSANSNLMELGEGLLKSFLK